MVITGHSGGGHFTTRWRKFCSKGFTIRDYKKALEAHVANGPQLSKVLGPAGLLGMVSKPFGQLVRRGALPASHCAAEPV